MASTSTLPPGSKVVQQNVLYCAICSFPPEYCEFSSRSSKCKQWLNDNHPDLYAKYYSDTALEDKLSQLTVEQREVLEKDLAKKERKDQAKAEREEAKLAASKVTIKRIERTKRKFVTGVHGLEHFGVDPKAAAKLFANHFATGASVSKNPQGEDEIYIQGDVSDEVEDLIIAKEGDNKKAWAVFQGKVDDDHLDFAEEKMKKK